MTPTRYSRVCLQILTLCATIGAASIASAESASIVVDADKSPVLVTWPVLLAAAGAFFFWTGLRRAGQKA